MRRDARRGMTLIEMLVVVAVIGLVVLIAAPVVLSAGPRRAGRAA